VLLVARLISACPSSKNRTNSNNESNYPSGQIPATAPRNALVAVSLRAWVSDSEEQLPNTKQKGRSGNTAAFFFFLYKQLRERFVSIPAAFMGVVIIWSTTPLAIKWSSDGGGYLFAVFSRMLLGLLVCLMLIALLSRRIRWRRDALLTYLAGGLGIWGAMTCVYWGVQYIPSGLVSLLFGLSPVVTALMAASWLRERALTPFRLLGMLLGLVGLGVIFEHSSELGSHAAWGMGAVLLSVHIHSASAVLIKRIGSRMHPLETTTGSLLVAVPLFTLNWFLSDGRPPVSLPEHALWSILYLGVVGSVFGFILYYYVLHHVQASRVALITLMTPVIALFLGQWLNGELIEPRELLGAFVILCGLTLFEWGEQWQRLMAARNGDSMRG